MPRWKALYSLLRISKRATIVQSTTETAVDYLLRSTSCYTVCRLLSAPLRERKRRLRKSRISSATRKKGRTAPKRIPESLAAQNFHWRCMANTIAKPSLGEHLRDRGTKKHRMIAKSVWKGNIFLFISMLMEVKLRSRREQCRVWRCDTIYWSC